MDMHITTWDGRVDGDMPWQKSPTPTLKPGNGGFNSPPAHSTGSTLPIPMGISNCR